MTELAEKKGVGMSFELNDTPSSWRLQEHDVPETPLHDAIIELLMLVLKHWAQVEQRSALVTSNLGCRWDPSDARVGTDPDVVLIDPAPAEGEAMRTLRVWEPGHAPPRVAVEVVSSSQPEKDYLEAPLRCARLGAKELWIFDPQLEGPDITGGPHLLQVWRLEQGEHGPRMRRSYAGPGPGYSDELAAWLVPTHEPARLRLARGPQGPFWPTPAEKERARAEEERARADAERARAEKERTRADEERARADKERARADAAERKFEELRRQLGLND